MYNKKELSSDEKFCLDEISENLANLVLLLKDGTLAFIDMNMHSSLSKIGKVQILLVSLRQIYIIDTICKILLGL